MKSSLEFTAMAEKTICQNVSAAFEIKNCVRLQAWKMRFSVINLAL
jgi:hypothetical protein